MPWFDIVCSDEADEKIAAHGVSEDEVEYVLVYGEHGSSRSSGRPLAMGRTRAGREIIVIYDRLDDITVMPITAYEPG